MELALIVCAVVLVAVAAAVIWEMGRPTPAPLVPNNVFPLVTRTMDDGRLTTPMPEDLDHG
jgi:hypothetical protein